jgi:hypothetical protein
MKKYEPIAPDATKRSRGQKTGTHLMRRLMLMLALVILSLLAQTIHIAAQEREVPGQRPSKQMTEQQARARVFALLQTEMKKTGSLRDGWQEGYKTSKGTIYAYVQRGQVRNIAVVSAKTIAPGSAKTEMAVEALKLYAPRGFGDIRDTGDTVVLQPNDDPTDEQTAKCKKKLGRCLVSRLFSFGAMKIAAAIVSESWVAVGIAILDEVENPPESLDTCVGETCRKILGIN